MAKQTIFGLEIDVPDNIAAMLGGKKGGTPTPAAGTPSAVPVQGGGGGGSGLVLPPALANLKNIPQQYIIIAVVVLVALLFAAGWWVLLRPMTTELDILKGEVTALTQERDSKRVRVAKIPILKEQAAKLQEQIALMSRVIPPKGNVPILLIDMERLSLSTNSKLTSFKNNALQPFTGVVQQAQVTAPGAPVTAAPAPAKAAIEDRLKELPISIVQDTTFAGLLKYTSNLEHYERVVRVNSIKIDRKPPTTGNFNPAVLSKIINLNVSMDITAYVLEGGIE